MSLVSRVEDSILLLKTKHGDQAAFAELYDKYVDALFRFAFYRLSDQEVAQDIVSDLFLKLWQRLQEPNSKSIENLRAFLYQMARNLIADYYRSRAATLPLEQAIEVQNSGLGSEQNIHQQVSLAEIEKALKLLKPEVQELIILAHVEGLSHKEIAIIIGKNVSATRVMLHRALQDLRKILQES